MNVHGNPPLSPAVLTVLLLLSVPVFCLAGCGLLNSGPAPTRLQIKPVLPARAVGPPVNKQLVVARPATGNVLAGDAIAVIFNSREIRLLADARWTADVPFLVQRSVVEALEATGGLQGVGDDTIGLAADARLLIDIREFGLRRATDDDVPSVGVFAAVFRLLDLRSGRISDSLHVEATAPAAGKSSADLAMACEAALSKGLAQCSAWVLSKM
ncbi:MAG: ABC-type transport auxiliary lipoprotein family protein [Desulfovibrio sp.]|jgi:ABC-type uncharacterized transport system auxiliary subunit|nr:ABC-type transport auxiliary lipoprotein family protein [Desulfovibrio sp.]